MRSEQAVLEAVLSFAETHDNIRVITLNGSRADPGAHRDDWMDYDLVFHVRSLAPFLADPGWSRVFGDIVIAQTPYFMAGSRDDYPNFMSWYADGTRTDIRVRPLEGLKAYLEEDSLTRVLLDKDGLLPALPQASDRTHRLNKPGEGKYRDSVNEFYWVSLYVSKALARGQYLAAVKYLEIIREELFRLLAWNIAHEADYTVNFGSQWRFLTDYLPEAQYAAVQATYDLMDIEGVRRSLARCRALFLGAKTAYEAKTGYTTAEDVPGILELERHWLKPGPETRSRL